MKTHGFERRQDPPSSGDRRGSEQKRIATWGRLWDTVSTPPFLHRLLTESFLDRLDFLTRRQPPEPFAPIVHQAASPPPRDPAGVARAAGAGIFIDRDKVGRTPGASPPCCIEHRRTTAQGQPWDEVSARPVSHDRAPNRLGSSQPAPFMRGRQQPHPASH